MQTLSTTRSKPSIGPWIFRFIYIVIIGFSIYGYLNLRDTSAQYDRTLAKQANAPVIAGKVQVGSTQVVIPSNDLFEAGEMWSLASKKHPLDKSFAVQDLIYTTIETGGEEKLQVSKRIVGPLNALVVAAEHDGHELMISSAYRSIADQQATYASFVARYGEQMAQEYVSPAGSSEHHTGLAVDLSDVSSACEQDSEKCSLGTESADWLMANAPRYGFILRYPEGKRTITGVGYEWWHFRYVGVPLAKALATSNLTLDEAVEQMMSR